jgi:hypothetical protein
MGKLRLFLLITAASLIMGSNAHADLACADGTQRQKKTMVKNVNIRVKNSEGNLELDNRYFTLPAGTVISVCNDSTKLVRPNWIESDMGTLGSLTKWTKDHRYPFSSDFRIESVPSGFGYKDSDIQDINEGAANGRKFISRSPSLFPDNDADPSAVPPGNNTDEEIPPVIPVEGGAPYTPPVRQSDDPELGSGSGGSGSGYSSSPRSPLPMIPPENTGEDSYETDSSESFKPTPGSSNLTFKTAQSWERSELNKFNGCETLADSQPDRGKLLQCSDSVSRHCGNKSGLQARKDCLFNLRSPRLREFIALTKTAYGEADRRMKQQDMLGIMKVVENRTSRCGQLSSKCDPLAIVMQRKQFSYFNSDFRGGSRTIKATSSDSHMRNAIDAYLKFQTSSFSSGWNDVYHYHGDYVSPNWAPKMNFRDYDQIKINGLKLKENGTRHIFLRDRSWRPHRTFKMYTS